MDIITKIKSECPPCDNACSMRSHCKANNDTCAQYTKWERTEKIDLEEDRTPKQLRTKRDKLKKRIYRHTNQEPAMIARQMKIKHWLGAMTATQLLTVARMLSLSTAELILMRSPGAGLTQQFMTRMHKPMVFKYLQEQGIAQEVAA